MKELIASEIHRGNRVQFRALGNPQISRDLQEIGGQLTHVLDLIQRLLLTDFEASSLLGEGIMVVLGSHGDF